MPYKFETDKIKMPRQHDRRVKLSGDDKARIPLLHDQGLSQRAIARAIGCSRRMVIYILYPERLARAKMLYKERRKDGRYYDKNKNTISQRNYRKYKNIVLKNVNYKNIVLKNVNYKNIVLKNVNHFPAV